MKCCEYGPWLVKYLTFSKCDKFDLNEDKSKRNMTYLVFDNDVRQVRRQRSNELVSTLNIFFINH
jgi:hypothetical protein